MRAGASGSRVRSPRQRKRPSGRGALQAILLRHRAPRAGGKPPWKPHEHPPKAVRSIPVTVALALVFSGTSQGLHARRPNGARPSLFDPKTARAAGFANAGCSAARCASARDSRETRSPRRRPPTTCPPGGWRAFQAAWPETGRRCWSPRAPSADDASHQPAPHRHGDLPREVGRGRHGAPRVGPPKR